jgi:hypothetical protein
LLTKAIGYDRFPPTFVTSLTSVTWSIIVTDYPLFAVVHQPIFQYAPVLNSSSELLTCRLSWYVTHHKLETPNSHFSHTRVIPWIIWTKKSTAVLPWRSLMKLSPFAIVSAPSSTSTHPFIYISSPIDEAFASKHMPDLGHDVKDFQVYTWRINNWKKLEKRLTSPDFECGGHKWSVYHTALFSSPSHF